MDINWRLKQRIGESYRSQTEFGIAERDAASIGHKVVGGRRDLPAGKKQAWAKMLKCSPEDLWKRSERN